MSKSWWTAITFTCCERCSASALAAFVASSSPTRDRSLAALCPTVAAAGTEYSIQIPENPNAATETSFTTAPDRRISGVPSVTSDPHTFGSTGRSCGIRLRGGARCLQSAALHLQLCADSLQRLRSRLGSFVCCQQRLQNTEAQSLASEMSVWQTSPCGLLTGFDTVLCSVACSHHRLELGMNKLM